MVAFVVKRKKENVRTGQTIGPLGVRLDGDEEIPEALGLGSALQLLNKRVDRPAVACHQHEHGEERQTADPK
jgi:hypothetical protein